MARLPGVAAAAAAPDRPRARGGGDVDHPHRADTRAGPAGHRPARLAVRPAGPGVRAGRRVRGAVPRGHHAGPGGTAAAEHPAADPGGPDPRAQHGQGRDPVRLLRAALPGGRVRLRDLGQHVAAPAPHAGVPGLGRPATARRARVSSAAAGGPPASSWDMKPSDTDAYIGLDLGTSGLKGVALAPEGTVIARGGAAYPTRRPTPGACEQAPQSWTAAAESVAAQLRDAVAPRRW